MPAIKVFLKGVSKALEFPESTKMEAIEKVVGSWDNVTDIKDLPMDTASRMERAEYLGYDLGAPLEHSSLGGPFQGFEEVGMKGNFDGVFASPAYSLKGADESYTFVGRNIADEGDADLDYDKAIETLKREYPGESEDFYDDLYDASAGDRFDPWDENILGKHGYEPGEASWEAQRLRGRIARDQGYDAVAMDDEFGVSYLIPAGSKARRVEAAFNPAKKESRNLLASLASGSVGLGALSRGNEGVASESANRLLELGRQRHKSRAYNIPHPALNRLGLLLQRGPQSFFTEGIGRGLETLSYGRQNELTDEEIMRRAIAVALDFL